MRSDFAILAALLGGCVFGIGEPPRIDVGFDTGFVDDPPETVDPTELAPPFAELRTDCTANGWLYDVRVLQVPDAAQLDIRQTGVDVPWNELHDVPYVGLDSAGVFGQLLLELLPSDEGFEPGYSSAYRCEEAPTLTWILRMFDDQGGQLGCIAWGSEPGLGDPWQCQQVQVGG